VNEWQAASGAVEVADRPWLDASRTVAAFGLADLPDAEPGWLERWEALDSAAEAAIAGVLAAHPEPTEPGAARDVLANLPAGSHLVVASSMPVRDLEWYAGPRPDVTVHANRGANGIDGTISTALGVAVATSAPTAVLLGDVAFLHDAGALVGLDRRGVDLTIVVVDNDGGGIFSFLPQADALPAERFEQLFGTPHGVRPEHLAAAHGLASLTVEDAGSVGLAVEASVRAGGARLVVVRTDRAANRALHDELHAAVAAAVSRQ
jgi:2-succinyl-5-enolpyruvyl-6-hydroxy-3-cyclohexene-1-carboxylate synthase